MTKVVRTLVALAIGLTVIFAVGAPANAAPAQTAAKAAALSIMPDCALPNGSDWKAWKSASWGRARICYDAPTAPPNSYFKVQTDDTLTDGYCVHAEMDTVPFPWEMVIGSESCGPVVTSPLIIVNGGPAEKVRLVRGPCICNGVGVNYFTLYP